MCRATKKSSWWQHLGRKSTKREQFDVNNNGDNIGNVCDADIAGAGGSGADDCTVNFFDLGQMKSVFFSSDADADLVGPGNSEPDGTVNFFDLGRMKSVFFAPPGPSAAGCN